MPGTRCFVLFVVAMGVLEQMGLPKNHIGVIFLLATVAVYAGIGMLSRTSDPSSTTSRAGACRRCTTAWRPRPTG